MMSATIGPESCLPYFPEVMTPDNCKKKFSLQHFYFMFPPDASSPFLSGRSISPLLAAILFKLFEKNVNKKILPALWEEFFNGMFIADCHTEFLPGEREMVPTDSHLLAII